MKFKVGDSVTIIKSNKNNKCRWPNIMSDFIGKKCTYIGKYGKYHSNIEREGIAFIFNNSNIKKFNKNNKNFQELWKPGKSQQQ